MPKSILEGLTFDSAKINSIGNYQLIDINTNRGAKNASPLKDWIENHVTDRNTYQRRHLIPTDETLWDEQQFDQFHTERSSLIVTKVLSYF